MSHLEGNVVQSVLSSRDLLHLLLDVLLCGSRHVDVVTVAAGVVAGDGLETHVSSQSCVRLSVCLCVVVVCVLPCGNPPSDSCRSRG